MTQRRHCWGRQLFWNVTELQLDYTAQKLRRQPFNHTPDLKNLYSHLEEGTLRNRRSTILYGCAHCTVQGVLTALYTVCSLHCRAWAHLQVSVPRCPVRSLSRSVRNTGTCRGPTWTLRSREAPVGTEDASGSLWAPPRRPWTELARRYASTTRTLSATPSQNNWTWQSHQNSQPEEHITILLITVGQNFWNSKHNDFFCVFISRRFILSSIYSLAFSFFPHSSHIHFPSL
jgi:hypothetical protein